ncbi:DUF3979 domain-containing protein [Bacillus pseudomycoides]|uniref:DUF3979 domain-containing protein n=1 Tax=Bacillus pseudomycoides TaxID=64104 RepID=A0AA91ZSC0_9BACI|nr:MULTISPECIES: DUF3979 family protein [Bacillus]PEB54268.1 DUF3979 domain-containing protein [Bacillus sp. AFS098217]PED80483.1 DUF3979 domain-containing protein [Bacillus pseudomycoides]PEU11166.1 DUF3979 domain-containing protein [Bacillus sp. AFS014408]PEU13093.1 DUF3979 domain-containing protein [Bacillus sp. AFS019443]PFW61932.1 DUF3979 domain-containing protein [Bacillus sp. AFS075034]
MLYEDLMTLFQVTPMEDGKDGWKYVIQEQNGTYSIVDEIVTEHMSVEIYFNEYDEIRITLYKDEKSITTIQRIAILKAELEEDEDAIQFVLERMPSRMIRLQLKPYLAVEMGLYWEVCEDCE